jgi:hypothetical protein
MPGQTYERITILGSPPNASGLSLSILQTLDATGPMLTGEPWYRCCQCGMDFPKSKVRFFRGKAYGVPCTDAQDIAQLARGKR